VHLTSEQFEAAQARGCQFQPASEAQIRQMAMQRRIFWLGAQAFTAQRSDGFFETAATLQKLLVEEGKAVEAPAPSQAAPGDDAPPAGASQPAEAAEAPVAAAHDRAAPAAPPAAPAPVVDAPEPATPAATHQRRRPEPVGDGATPDQSELELELAAELPQQPEPDAVLRMAQPAAPAIATPSTAPMPVDERDVMQCLVTIVDGYARHNAMGAAELSALIANVHDTLSGLLHAEEAPVPEPSAARQGPSRRRRGRPG
jgi:hypothetical protein